MYIPLPGSTPAGQAPFISIPFTNLIVNRTDFASASQCASTTLPSFTRFAIPLQPPHPCALHTSVRLSGTAARVPVDRISIVRSTIPEGKKKDWPPSSARSPVSLGSVGLTVSSATLNQPPNLGGHRILGRSLAIVPSETSGPPNTAPTEVVCGNRAKLSFSLEMFLAYCTYLTQKTMLTRPWFYRSHREERLLVVA